ncbi:hypothetical protein [Haladaptatus halobius]|uniref:hypothetical protein n=1 Tax=Haladaptatus halobius TaxID=2884875 RepID=UPI001D0AA465|nr:hypothetical protein [Haladaptatus halobius]
MRPKTLALLGVALALGPYAVSAYLRGGPWLWFTLGACCLGSALVLKLAERNAPQFETVE